MKVQRSNFGIKVAGYMGEAGYTSDEYIPSSDDRAWDVVRIPSISKKFGSSPSYQIPESSLFF